MERQDTIAPASQAVSNKKAHDVILRQGMLRQRKPFGGGGRRLETGDTIDTSILSGKGKPLIGRTG